MTNKKIERIKFASTLRKDLYEKLQKKSNETDIPLSKLFDRAVEYYLQKEKSSDK
jgi:hypothetical protein